MQWLLCRGSPGSMVPSGLLQVFMFCIILFRIWYRIGVELPCSQDSSSMPSMPAICAESGSRRSVSGCCGRGPGAMSATTSCVLTCLFERAGGRGQHMVHMASVVVQWVNFGGRIHTCWGAHFRSTTSGQSTCTRPYFRRPSPPEGPKQARK